MVLELEGVTQHYLSGVKWGLDGAAPWDVITNVEGLMEKPRPPPSSLEPELGKEYLLSVPFCWALGTALSANLMGYVGLGRQVNLGESLMYRMAVSTVGQMRDSSLKQLRVPPIGSTGDPLSRWTVCVQGTWYHSEHNDIGEARGVVACLHHASRSFSLWNKRILLITDSLVTLGIFCKGRTSSRGLLRQARI